MPTLTMLYKVAAGVVEETSYGIQLARVLGFPQSFIEKAESTAASLRKLAESKQRNSRAHKLAKRRKLVLGLHETLKQAAQSGMDDAALASYLRRLQVEFVTRMEELGNGENDARGASGAYGSSRTSTLEEQASGNGNIDENLGQEDADDNPQSLRDDCMV
jgi:DNA mismatch repair protein MSH4